jgi:hypothetical protein
MIIILSLSAALVFVRSDDGADPGKNVEVALDVPGRAPDEKPVDMRA